MANNEHPDEDKFEGVELTIEQWKQVIEKAVVLKNLICICSY